MLLVSSHKKIINLVSHVLTNDRFVPLKSTDTDILSCCAGRVMVMLDDLDYPGPYVIYRTNDNKIALYSFYDFYENHGSNYYIVDATVDNGKLVPITDELDIKMLFNNYDLVLYDKDKNYIRFDNVIIDYLANKAIGSLTNELTSGVISPLSQDGIDTCRCHNLDIDHEFLNTPGITFHVLVSENLSGNDYSGYDSDPGNLTTGVEYRNNYHLEFFFPHMTNIPDDYDDMIGSRVHTWGGYNEHRHTGLDTDHPRHVTDQTLVINDIHIVNQDDDVLLYHRSYPYDIKGIIYVTVNTD